MIVVLRTLRDLRRGLIGWSVGVAAIVVVMTAIWPSMRDMPDLEAFLANYPEPMLELFDIAQFTTGAGYLNAELFSFMMPLLFVVHAVSRGTRLVAGEEDDGVLEVVLTVPRARWRVLVAKALALSLSVGVLGLVLFSSLVIAGAAVGMDIGSGDLAAASASMTLFGIEFGLLALAVGAATGRRAVAMGVASVAAVGAYVLFAASRLVGALEGWEVVSPVQHALRDGPVGSGWDPGHLSAMAVAGAVAILLAVPVFSRRDIG